MHKYAIVMQRRVAIIGASGYTGVELTRLLDGHPEITLAAVSSDRWVGDSVEARTGVPGALRYGSLEDTLAEAARCDVTLLATPAEASLALAPKLLAAGTRVIDLSGAFRLRDAGLYPTFYKLEHPHRELLASAVYGLPELGARDAIAAAKLVANPGCYATAIQLALAPLVAAGISGRPIVDAMSGVTGAGRKASEEYSFAEIAGDLRVYRALEHQHRPEIEQQLGCEITFVPHLLPVQRGILATCHVTTSTDPARAFSRYEREPFVSLAASAEDVTLHHVVGTNRCRIGWTRSDRGELVVTSAIDNLVKGAAGQAVQNLNLMLGLDEAIGLAGLRSFHP
jgi:N-acetyl-gamma-glutamyl-phosphate reductase